MKYALYLFLLSGLFSACGPSRVVVQSDQPVAAPPPTQAVAVTYQSFYDELSPYGQWIDYPGYGYVWMPSTGYGFKPYSTNGHWVYSDMGWTWASDYQWGWAAFHYGRWFYDGGYGWMWIPGQEWAPAWVSWRSSPDYYGWAPLGPNVAYGSAYNPPANYWCFVPHQYINNTHMNNYYVNESRNVTIINNTTVINNYNNGNSGGRNVYRGGPDAREVERVSGVAVRPVVIRESNRPGEQLSNNQYNIYRPRVNTPVQNSANLRPQRVEPLRNVRPATINNQGNMANQPVAPVNNQPVTRNDGRPATQAPANNPAYNNNPSNQPVAPVNNQPVIRTDGRPVTNPTNNNNRPTNNQPAVQPDRPVHQSPAPPVNNNHPVDPRTDHGDRSRSGQQSPNQSSAVQRPASSTAPAQNGQVPASRPAPVTRTNPPVQNTHPANLNSNPANSSHTRTSQPQAVKPVAHPSTQKPVTRSNEPAKPEDKK